MLEVKQNDRLSLLYNGYRTKNKALNKVMKNRINIVSSDVEVSDTLTLEALRGGQIDPPSIFLALNFCSLTDYQKIWYDCFLFVNTSFDTN